MEPAGIGSGRELYGDFASVFAGLFAEPQFTVLFALRTGEFGGLAGGDGSGGDRENERLRDGYGSRGRNLRNRASASRGRNSRNRASGSGNRFRLRAAADV